MPNDGLSLRDALDRWGNPDLLLELKKLGPSRQPVAVYSKFIYGADAERWNAASRSELARELKKEQVFRMLVAELVDRLSAGELVATGHEYPRRLNGAPKKIDRDLWRRLKPNFRDSSAKGDGLHLVDIRVTEQGIVSSSPAAIEGRIPGVGAAPGARKLISQTELRNWYDKHLARLKANNEVSSRDGDREAARREFDVRVTYAMVDAVRREMAPPAWTERGRRKGQLKKPRK